MIKILGFLSLFLVFSLNALEILEEKVNQDLAMIQYPRKAWITPRFTKENRPILNVAIVGGGQTGLTMAFALQRQNIDQIQVFDENRENEAGAWIRLGKMKILRTPKYTTGPDLDIPCLTIQSWFSAKYGEEAWKNLDYIPRLDWHEYLNWYRKVLHLPVQFESKVGPLSWDEDNQCFRFFVTRGEEKEEVWARKIILAVGLEGSGGWMIPEFIRNQVLRTHYAQAMEKISPEMLAGKDVAILGAGPNAFDFTLESARHGAKSITLFSKKPKLVNLHCFKWGEYAGFLKSFCDLEDVDKYRFVARFHEMGQPPVPCQVAAAYQLPNFQARFNSPWQNAYQKGDKVVVETPQGSYEFDFLILATGWISDLSARPEIKNFQDQIATWADQYTPEETRSYEKLLKFPYLGRGFQFTEKHLGAAPYVNSIFNMTGGGLLSNGFCAGTGLTGMKYSIQLVTHEIVSQFFLEDKEAFYNSLDQYNVQDFSNEIYY